MKKIYIKSIGLCAVVCIIVLALMGATENPQTKKVRDLLEKRNVVMENVLFGKITYDEGKLKLREIETEELYRQDVDNLLKYNNTDLEKVENMEVLRLEQKGDIYDILTFEGELRWTYSNMEKRYSEINIYQIGISQKGDDYKLISFELQEK